VNQIAGTTGGRQTHQQKTSLPPEMSNAEPGGRMRKQRIERG
jgi:hypothetical protein